MAKKIVVARNPEKTKVTTISIRLGHKGVPYGWEYIICDQSEIPDTNKLEPYWAELSQSKKIQVSTMNKNKVSMAEVNSKLKMGQKRIDSIYAYRQFMLSRLDIDFIRTMEDKRLWRVTKAIIKQKEELRQLEVNPDDFDSTEDLLEYWPEVFNRKTKDYIYIRNMTPVYISGSLILTILTMIGLAILFL